MTSDKPFNFPGSPTLAGPVPAGYRVTVRSRVLRPAARGNNGRGGTGPKVTRGAAEGGDRALFERAAEGVLGWRIHSGSGFRAISVPKRVTVGAVSEWEIPFGPLHPRVRCRVFSVVIEPDRVGFGHGALVGHPQSGWESYFVTAEPNGTTTLTVRVVWRPAAWWMRLSGPAGRVALNLLLRRNLRALDGWLAVA